MQSVASFSLWWPRFNPRAGHVGLVEYKVELELILSKYFGPYI
jgi:hypothetical protein